jgi:hypothetical protein
MSQYLSVTQARSSKLPRPPGRYTRRVPLVDDRVCYPLSGQDSWPRELKEKRAARSGRRAIRGSTHGTREILH